MIYREQASDIDIWEARGKPPLGPRWNSKLIFSLSSRISSSLVPDKTVEKDVRSIVRFQSNFIYQYLSYVITAELTWKTILGWCLYNLPKCTQTSYINIWAKRARSNFLLRDASRCQNRFAVGKHQLVWKLYTLFLFLSKVNLGRWWLLTTAGKQSIKVWLNWRCVKTITDCIGSAIQRDRTQEAIRECLTRTSRRTRSAKPFIGESRSPQRC